MLNRISSVSDVPYCFTPSLDTRKRQWRNATLPVVQPQPADVVSFGRSISVKEIKKHFKGNRIIHPVIDIAKELIRKSPDLKALRWIKDWKLHDGDYKNMIELMKMHNWKYIDMWQSTSADGVPSMQKLAVLVKVLRRNRAMNDITSLNANAFDAIVKGTCSAKPPEAIEALLTYIADSTAINQALSDPKLMTPEIERKINAITKLLKSAVTEYEIIVYKGDGYKGVLNLRETSDGRKIGKAMEEMVESNTSDSEKEKFITQELIGKSFFQERFSSTSLTESVTQKWAQEIERDQKATGRVRWKITVPAGTKGEFIEPFNISHEKLNEILIQRDSELVVVDAKFDKAAKTWIIEAVLMQK